MRFPRHSFFIVFLLFSSVLLYDHLRELLYFSTKSNVYSYIPLIPVVTIFLLYSDRKAIFSDPGYGFVYGGAVLIAALTVSIISRRNLLDLTMDYRLSLASLAIVSAWVGGFVLCYGIRAFKIALFPLLFLLFMVPFPDSILDVVIAGLQEGSFMVTVWIFKIMGVKIYTSGFVISLPLPRFDIEVAKECSGIRSSMSLFITSLLIGRFFLSSPINKCILALTVIPIAVFKNAVRIVFISLGALYLDEEFISGPLHHKGGVLFFILGLSLLALIARLLRGRERLDALPNGPS